MESSLIEVSPHESEIIRLIIAERLPNREIGKRLGISPVTVAKHLAELYAKLGLETWGDSRIRMVLWALKEGGFHENKVR